MNNLPLPEPQLLRRSRMRCWLRRVHYEMTLSRPTRKCSRAVEAMVGALLLAVLAAILFPVFAVPPHGNGRSSCMSNLRQIGGSV